MPNDERLKPGQDVMSRRSARKWIGSVAAALGLASLAGCGPISVPQGSAWQAPGADGGGVSPYELNLGQELPDQNEVYRYLVGKGVTKAVVFYAGENDVGYTAEDWPIQGIISTLPSLIPSRHVRSSAPDALVIELGQNASRNPFIGIKHDLMKRLGDKVLPESFLTMLAREFVRSPQTKTKDAQVIPIRMNLFLLGGEAKVSVEDPVTGWSEFVAPPPSTGPDDRFFIQQTIKKNPLLFSLEQEVTQNNLVWIWPDGTTHMVLGLNAQNRFDWIHIPDWTEDGFTAETADKITAAGMHVSVPGMIEDEAVERGVLSRAPYFVGK